MCYVNISVTDDQLARWLSQLVMIIAPNAKVVLSTTFVKKMLQFWGEVWCQILKYYPVLILYLNVVET